MNRKAMFVIDMLNGFANQGPLSSENVKKIIPFIERELSTDEYTNYFICDAHSENDIEMQQYPIHCLKDSQESQVVQELEKYVDHYVYKDTTNGFFEVSPAVYESYDEFYLTGCCTDICILQFGLSLKMYLNKIGSNKPVYVFKDGVSTFDSPDHNAAEFHEFALKLMANAGLKII
ncbi:isochorismatase family cysteine hydrolase [Mycoplasma sp. Ms02]|uniref:isochorismatase family cysteine hydrolase n=1 Tax=Mycoplasma sp. Ms02 TaxID=353851 RepID=UPI00210808AF|nr:isochorismatase family cysteine hydrolase [Mycoplasma sp. Ms02]